MIIRMQRCLSLGFLLLVGSAEGFTQPGTAKSNVATRVNITPKLQHLSVPGQSRNKELFAAPNFESNEEDNNGVNWPLVGLLGTISSVYWYWMVLAAAAVANDWPLANLIPGAIPLVPGWPPSDQDLAPVIEDSFHFFYLSDLLQNPDAPTVNPLRLAAFNVDEAWIFAYLIALWKDPKRLPRPVLLGTWLLLGINLTNAFLAPYLLVAEFNTASGKDNSPAGKNPIASTLFGGIATAVIGYAIATSIGASPQDWVEFKNQVVSDRTYLAFCVDLPLFAFFQPILLSRVKSEGLEAIDYIPIVGLLKWIFLAQDEEGSDE